ncbi:rhomboid family intramembrane serine protease [Rubritalea tangerina]|uniref:Rhomboid family intramembrane serine protease n=1 Tax=Rubritalea tangerina TaxID=430798 RepID=A0ABW4ZB76_9BACT
MKSAHPKKQRIAQQRPTFMYLLDLVLIAWIIEAVDQFFLAGQLDRFGIHPRQAFGLLGIPIMPWLHGGFGHLSSNTVPFLTLGYIMLKSEGRRFYYSSAIIILLGGLGTWLIGGTGEVHIGASGLIYGYFGYVMTRAIIESKPLWLITGILVAVFYGSMIFGVLPQGQIPVSWEGHLTGMLAGIWLGRRHKGLSSE